MATTWDRHARVNKMWKHRRLQVLVRRIPLALLAAVAIFLIVQGFWVLHDYTSAISPTA
jgi:hypothetical protein